MSWTVGALFQRSIIIDDDTDPTSPDLLWLLSILEPQITPLQLVVQTWFSLGPDPEADVAQRVMIFFHLRAFMIVNDLIILGDVSGCVLILTLWLVGWPRITGMPYAL